MIPPASEADDLDALSLALSILDSGGGENRGGGGVGNGDDDADFPNFDTIDVDVDDDAGVEGFDEFAIDSDGEAEADNFLNLVIDDHPAVQFDVSPLAREVNVGGGRGGDDGTTGMAVAVPNNPTPPSTFSSSSDPHGRMPQMHHVISHPLAVPRAQQEVRPPSIPPSNAATQGRGPIGGTTSIGGGGVAVGGGGGVVGGWTSSLASFAGSLLQQSSSSMHPHPSSSSSSSSSYPHFASTGATTARDDEIDARLRAAFASRISAVNAAGNNAGGNNGGGTTATGAGAGHNMSYQERQRILLSGQLSTPSVGGASSSSPSSSSSSSAALGNTATTPVTTKISPASGSRAVPSPPTTTRSEEIASTAPRHPPTATTFAERLNASLDSRTRTRLINSVLDDRRQGEAHVDDDSSEGGRLLPGEQVVMFLNALDDVRDCSTDGHVFVGSRDILAGCRRCHDEGEDGTVTVWCCVTTNYRVAVFSYRATSDGRVLLSNDSYGEGGERTAASENNIIDNHDEVDDDGGDMIRQWLDSQSVSIQFQVAHQSPSPSFRRWRLRAHHVFQMPLASIERVEKTLSSSQRAVSVGYGYSGGSGMNPSSSSSSSTASSYSHPYVGGYSAMQQLLQSSPSSSAAAPSSSSANAINSAMVSLGSQMRPLLGGSSGNFNLLSNGAHNNNGGSMAGIGTMEPLGIILHGKDGGRWIEFSTCSHTDAQRAHEVLNTYAFPGRRNMGYLFAFESRRAEVMSTMAATSTAAAGSDKTTSSTTTTASTAAPGGLMAKATRRRFVPLEEYERQGVFRMRHGEGVDGDIVTHAMHQSPWAPILSANVNYGLCSTYPSVLVGPRCIVGGGGAHDNSVGLLRRCAAFRSENRLPALTWGNPRDGGSIWRAAQPKVGLQGNRSAEDERYLYAIGEEAKRANDLSTAERPPIEFLRMLCGRNNENDLIIEGTTMGTGNNPMCMLKVMDMRPKTSAMANRTQGYGYENTNNYRGTTINFYGIGNIHVVRDAYQKLTSLCLNPNISDLQWGLLVENTNWLSIVRLVLSASWQTAFHVHYNRLPVLIHCSHGWDRTSQVTALAQLMLDPHYRTREGFSTLVEKDFLSFGHPFNTRCGHGEGKNEQGGDEGELSPIFLQFLDCVFQLVNQFPDYFEFSTRYLLLLSEHIYSCRFGTLLCDSEKDREVVAGIRQRTHCMWDYLDSIPELLNPLFDKAASDKAGVLLMPLPMLLRNVTLWTDRFCMYNSKATMPCIPPSLIYQPKFVASCRSDQSLVLHTSRNRLEGMLSRALKDVEVWKERASAVSKELREITAECASKKKAEDAF